MLRDLWDCANNLKHPGSFFRPNLNYWPLHIFVTKSYVYFLCCVCVCTQTIPFCRQKPYNTIHWWVYMVNIYHGLAAIDLVRICSYKSKILHVLGLSFLTCRLAAGMVSSKWHCGKCTLFNFDRFWIAILASYWHWRPCWIAFLISFWNNIIPFSSSASINPF